MAVQLFLDDEEVIIDSSQEIRITRENPFFTLSDSYTLDISIPLDIVKNRVFFGCVNRPESKKKYREFSCRLYCNNTILVEGMARIVQSTESVVKVQLASGVSALKMSSEQEGEYIDRMDLGAAGTSYSFPLSDLDYGATIGPGHAGYGVILRDSTNDTIVNIGSADAFIGRTYLYVSECPRLIDIAKMVASKLGYTIDLSCLPEACGHIYVVTAIQGRVAKKLPHWTVKEFFREFQNFFGCTFVRSGKETLKLVPLRQYIDNPVTIIDPVAEFQVDYSEDDDTEGVMNSNIEFGMENSDTETVDDDTLGHAEQTAEYTDIGRAENAFRSDSEDVRMHKIYKVSGETYIGWKEEEGQYELKRIAPFNPLVRDENAGSTTLKIAPAYMEEGVDCELAFTNLTGYGGTATVTLNIPSVTNPYGIKDIYETLLSSHDETPTLQELVEGTESIVSEDDKPDVMSVVFMDGNEETVKTVYGTGNVERTFTAHLAFTDYSFKMQLTNNRRKWSFSLNELQGYEFYLGQLHRLPFRCTRGVKHLFRFLSDYIPDADNVFIVRGKRYASEKIEAKIKDGQLDRLMTGYFYEIIS